MDVLDIIAAALFAVTLTGVANAVWLKLPQAISVVLFSVMASVALKVASFTSAGATTMSAVTKMLEQIDFHAIVMNGLLGFMLFAGAICVDLNELSKRKWPIAMMATVGVVVSTAIVAVLCRAAWWLLGINVPIEVCIVFGALISPTDPVAVLAIMKTVHVPKSLQAKIAGESLFNDGVAVVVFTAALAVASPFMGDGVVIHPTVLQVAELFTRDAFGGAALGAVLGWNACRLIEMVDDHALEIMITVTLVAVVMSLSQFLDVSGPIAVVVAGIIMGSIGKTKAMNEFTRAHLESFWAVLDECINSVIFLLLGLEAIVIEPRFSSFVAAAVAIPAVLTGRLISVSTSIMALRILGERFQRYTSAILTWGGLRGAVSLALAISLPEGRYRHLLLSVTYLVVIFSIVVQGLSVKHLLRITTNRPRRPADA
jgi:CPA1 family monovalent cation:H+ antiporter